MPFDGVDPSKRGGGGGGGFSVWAIYHAPPDMGLTYEFIAKAWYVCPRGHTTPHPIMLGAPEIEILRAYFLQSGLSRLPAPVDDTPHLIECWM